MSVPDTPSYRKRIGYHTGLLGLFAFFASTALMLSFLGTKDDIALRLQEDLKATLGKVIPSGLYDNNIATDTITIDAPNSLSEKEPVTIYLARKENEIVAISFQSVAPDGYAGVIVIMLGVDVDGNLLGVRVISHSETPGLGDKIEVKKNKWILGFNGLSLVNTSEKEWKVKKDGGKFDQFTGATITPRAVVKAVKRGLDFYVLNKTDLLKRSSLSRGIE